MKTKPYLFLILLAPVFTYFVAKFVSFGLDFFSIGFLSFAYMVVFYVKVYSLVAIALYLGYAFVTQKWDKSTWWITLGLFGLSAIWIDVFHHPLLAVGGGFFMLSAVRSYFNKDSFLGFCKDLFLLFLSSCFLGFFFMRSPWLGLTGFLVSQILFEMLFEKPKSFGKKDKFWQAYAVAKETLAR